MSHFNLGRNATMVKALKKNNTIGCCGIDCGLCPRFHTKGDSVCPGCGGRGFKDKHPTCGCLTCCVTKNRWEVCSQCEAYPCYRFDKEKINQDSFVTHAKIFANLDFIKKSGVARFISRQKIRMNILKDFLARYDDGRSKSFFCICTALLPLDKLQKVHCFIENINDSLDLKEKNRRLKSELQGVAEKMKIELKLNSAAK
jgi:hypothetical protein